MTATGSSFPEGQLRCACGGDKCNEQGHLSITPNKPIPAPEISKMHIPLLLSGQIKVLRGRKWFTRSARSFTWLSGAGIVTAVLQLGPWLWRNPLLVLLGFAGFCGLLTGSVLVYWVVINRRNRKARQAVAFGKYQYRGVNFEIIHQPYCKCNYVPPLSPRHPFGYKLYGCDPLIFVQPAYYDQDDGLHPATIFVNPPRLVVEDPDNWRRIG